jgi:hypothetical protein
LRAPKTLKIFWKYLDYAGVFGTILSGMGFLTGDGRSGIEKKEKRR